jgi:MFS family permease
VPARERLLTLPFALVFAASFLGGLSYMSYVHLPGYLQALGADETLIGVIVATSSAVALVVRPSIGAVLDLRGRRGVLLVGNALHVVACALYLTVTAIGPWVFAVRAVHGVAAALTFSVTFTIAADIVPVSRRAQGIAVFGISGMLPIALGGVLGDVVLADGTYDDLFMVTAVLSALALLTALPVRDSRPAPVDGELRRSFLRSVVEPDLRPLWLAGVGFAFAISSYFTFLKTFVLETGVGSVGTFFTAYAVTAVVLRAGLGWLPDRVGLKATLFPSFLATAAGIVVLGAAGSASGLVVAGIACGAGHGYAFPVISALVVNRARGAERGAAVTAFTALFDAGVLLGSPLLGAVVEAASYRVMFAVAAGAMVATAVGFGIYDRGR